MYMQDGSDLPLTVLGGSPGYINLLDALNALEAEEIVLEMRD